MPTGTLLFRRHNDFHASFSHRHVGARMTRFVSSTAAQGTLPCVFKAKRFHIADGDFDDFCKRQKRRLTHLHDIVRRTTCRLSDEFPDVARLDKFHFYFFQKRTDRPLRTRHDIAAH